MPEIRITVGNANDIRQETVAADTILGEWAMHKATVPTLLDDSDCWAITHVPTSLKLPVWPEDRNHALKLLEMLAAAGGGKLPQTAPTIDSEQLSWRQKYKSAYIEVADIMKQWRAWCAEQPAGGVTE